MRHFDEQRLLGRLDELPVSQRVAFAAAAATRQIENVGRTADHDPNVGTVFQVALDVVWAAVTSTDANPSVDWAEIEVSVFGHIMDDADDDVPMKTVWHALSDDALSSLVYAIRAIKTGLAQEAAWAARCAYEAADQAAIRLLGGVQTALPETERAILAHPVVQRELGQQADDLAEAGNPKALRMRALRSPLLSAEDVSTLGGNSG